MKKEPRIHYISFIPIFRGFALPYIGIIIQEKYRGDQGLIKHEKVHLKQIKRMTLPVYIIRYIFQLIFIGYDSMPMELEARQHDVSLWNYRERHWNNEHVKIDKHLFDIDRHRFLLKEIMDLKIDPICTCGCNKTLSVIKKLKS